MKHDLFFKIILLLAFLGNPVWAGEWIQDGGCLSDPSQNAFHPIITGNSTPFVTFQEDKFYYYKASPPERTFRSKMSYWDGSNWIGTTDGLSEDFITRNCSFQSFENTPYITCYINSAPPSPAFIARYAASNWETLSISNAYAPSLAFKGGVLYSAYRMDGDLVYVSHFNGSGWQADGGCLNATAIQSSGFPSPIMTVHDDTLYVEWEELVQIGSHYQPQSFLKHLEGSTWVQDDLALSWDPDNSNYIGTTFTASTGSYAGVVNNNNWLYIKHYNGTNWEVIGNGVGNFAIVNNTIYSYSGIYSSNGLYAQKYNGSNWEQIGSRINTELGVQAASIANINNTPFITWVESSNDKLKVYVKHYDPTVFFTPTSTSTLSPTPTITPTAFISNGILQIYPNPANTHMNFYFPTIEIGSNIKIYIFNLAGEPLCKPLQAIASKDSLGITWNCQNIAAGLYFAQILKNGQKYRTIKCSILHR